MRYIITADLKKKVRPAICWWAMKITVVENIDCIYTVIGCKEQAYRWGLVKSRLVVGVSYVCSIPRHFCVELVLQNIMIIHK